MPRQVVIENPIINSSFVKPQRYFRFDDEGTGTKSSLPSKTAGRCLKHRPKRIPEKLRALG